VSGAFDRVSSERLLAKLKARGVHEKLLAVLASWLDTRAARVCVDGSFSAEFSLSDMVYQGTVLGPPLWNCFYADAAEVAALLSLLAKIFADDLNCFRILMAVMATISSCRRHISAKKRCTLGVRLTK